jgi:hypothetical protein
MISETQESNLSQAAAGSAKRRQDKTHPMVIHMTSGRLMPNTPRLRVHKDYRVYTGALDADLPTRMRWLAGMSKMPTTVNVTNSKEAEDNFDLGAATKDDIVTFAFEQYGAVLDPAQDIRVLRKAVMKLFEASAVPA